MIELMKYFPFKVCLWLSVSAFLIFVFGYYPVQAESIYQADQDNSTSFVQNEILVKFKSLTPSFLEKSIVKSHNSHITRSRNYADFLTIAVPNGFDPKNFAQKLADNPFVAYAEPNFLAYATFKPNDPYYSLQWNLDNPASGSVKAEPAWDKSKGENTLIAVLDTGIAYENRGSRFQKAPDFAQTCFTKPYNFIRNNQHANDDNGHGTHVAGTLAQSTNNSLGTAGLAFKSCLIPIKVLNQKGSGTYADIAEGIRYAADQGAQVINLSLGGSADAKSLKEAIAYAYAKGVVIIVAAGNNSNNSVLYPAAYDDFVIAVGATRFDETLAPYSNYGASIDLVAPGGDLNVDQNNDGYKDGILQQTFGKNPRDWGYWFYQGTSMAAPHVSAIAALVIANGTSKPSLVRQTLQSSAKDLGSPGKDNIFGWGLVNAAAALQTTSPSPSPTALPSPSPSPSPAPSPSPSPSPSPNPSPSPQPKPISAVITNHHVSTRWSRRNKGKIDLYATIKINSGSTTNLVLTEIPDQIGNWSLYRNQTRVIVYINNISYRLHFTFNNQKAVIDLSNLGLTFQAGDTIEISRLRLANNTQGSHHSNLQVKSQENLLDQNTISFDL